MATTLINKSQNVNDQDGYAGYRFRLEVILNSYDATNATYNVTINHYVKGDSGTNHVYHGLTQPNSIIRAYVGDTKILEQITNVSQIRGSETLGGTWTDNIRANADGNLTVRYLGKYAPNKTSGYLPKTNTVEETIAMPTIPRYATITSFVVNQRDETSLNVTWSANAVCDYAWYRIRQSGGSYGNWIGGVGTNFDITGLSAGITYIVQIQVRRQDSQLVTPSGEYTQTTYNYPYVSNTPNFTIGSSSVLGLYNRLGRTCKVYIKNPLNTEKEIGTTTTELITIPNTQEWQTFFYNGIPDSPSGLYRVRLVCEELSRDTTVDGGTYSVNPETNKPNVTNCAGTYTANLTNLTNNNQTVINNTSTLTYRVTTGATALNGASIAKYIVDWGTAHGEIENIANTTQLPRGSGNTISVTVRDSRGLTNTFSTSISEVITYTNPTGLSITPSRLNGVSENVFLDADGIIYYDKFGTNGVSNKITSIKYSIANESAQNVSVSLSSLAYSQQDINAHTQKFSIIDAPISIDGHGGGFDTTKTYNITVVVTDTSGNSATITGTIKDGKFAMIKYRDSNGNYHTGINGLPDTNYALKVHGEVNADNIFNPYPVGAIYISDNSTSPASLFGGTWEQLNGYYLYAGNGYSKTSYTGKNAQLHTLTANQSGLRQHNHGASGSFSANFYIRHGNSANRDMVANGTNTSVDVGVGASWGNGVDMTSYTHNIDRVNIGGDNKVTVGVNNQGPWDATEGHPHNIATLEIYAWRRTA